MPYRQLFILCEGDDDGHFFRHVIVPLLDYDDVRFYQYAQRRSRDVRSMIRSVQSMGADYIFVCDFDRGECIPSRREAIASQYVNLDPERIFVVQEAIESWYVAGLRDEARRRLEISSLQRRTDELTKGHFDNALPEGEPRISLMREMLDVFDLAVARRRNRSFDYFVRKIL